MAEVREISSRASVTFFFNLHDSRTVLYTRDLMLNRYSCKPGVGEPGRGFFARNHALLTYPPTHHRPHRHSNGEYNGQYITVDQRSN